MNAYDRVVQIVTNDGQGPEVKPEEVKVAEGKTEKIE